MTAPQDSSTLSAAEKAALKETVQERRARAKGVKAEDDVKAVLAAIEKMSDEDRELCSRLHEIITTAGPDLAPRTWYGMPAYAKDGKVLLAVKNAGKFGQRYTTLEFQDAAALDSGSMWPVGYAVARLTKTGEKEVAALVRRAVG
jgi:uncharacterized protein YdhG (YjbR/CyaY superfamily)